MKKNGIIAASATVLLLSASCASVPKSKSTPQSTQPSRDELKTEAVSVSSVPFSAAEKTAENISLNQDTGKKEDYSDLSEPVVPDMLPDSVPITPLPEKNVIPPAEKEIDEPVVYDEAYQEKNTKKDPVLSAVSDTQSEPLQPSVQNPVMEKKDAPVKSDEITSVKRAADVLKTPTASSPLLQQKTSSVHNKSDALPGKSIKVPASENSIPSRSVTISKNQYLDVEYPGTGWIYLGETDGTRNMTFSGRKLGDTDTSFTLKARNTGTSVLHFYKNDILTGKYIDDYLKVTVTDNADSTQKHVNAPLYADIVPPDPSSAIAEQAAAVTSVQNSRAGTTPSQSDTANADTRNTADGYTQKKETPAADTAFTGETPVKTIIQTTESSPDSQTQAASFTPSADRIQTDQSGEAASDMPSATDSSDGSAAQNESPDDLLKDAQNAYNTAQYEKAQSLLTLFFDKAVTRIDEGLYLQGQVLEAKSSIQNIKGAVNSYEILMKNWPDSTLWQNARQRDIYLHRMYLDIR
ncbi:MAG: hypothetical protein M0P01_10860 [Treponema sp.]|nr:hypothetical protein [Treponema sp.]